MDQAKSIKRLKKKVQRLRRKANRPILAEEMRERMSRAVPAGPNIAHDSVERMIKDAQAWRAFKRKDDDGDGLNHVDDDGLKCVDDDGLKCVKSTEQPPVPHAVEESVPTSCPWSCCTVGGRDVRRGRRGGFNLRSDYGSKLPFAELRNVKESDDRMFDF